MVASSPAGSLFLFLSLVSLSPFLSMVDEKKRKGKNEKEGRKVGGKRKEKEEKKKEMCDE
jgi:hypothetical protein